MNNQHWMGFSKTAVAAAVAVVSVMATAPVLAQNTSAGVAGRVVGASGQPVAGATVTIVHVESGAISTLTTDSEGRYAARGLRVGGPYTITVTQGGLTDRQEGIFLALAETLSFDSRLAPATATIVVTGRSASDRFNSGNMGAGTNIGQRELQAYASVGRNLQDYARADPRLSQTDKERGEISALGQNTRFNSVTIDGVTINDTFGLESNNLPTIKQPISIDVIQSVQVNLSNYDVTQKGYTGANINAVTKSGTNEFSGSVYYVTRDDSLVGKRYDNRSDTYSDAPAFEESTVGFTLSGPIIKDTLFFLANYEEFTSSRTSPDWGVIGSARPNVGITQSAIDGATAVASSTYPGYVVGTPDVPGGTEVSVKDTLLKLNWEITDGQRAGLRYTKTEQAEPIFPGFGSRSISLNSHWYNQVKEIETLVGEWFADWTPNFSTEFKYSTRDYVSAPVNATRQPFVNLSFTGDLPAGTPPGVLTGTRTLLMGTERFRHFNELATETTDLYLAGNYYLGDHELKFGVDSSDNDIFNAFLSDALGNYTFRCEDGVYSFGTVDCGADDAATIEQAVLENFRNGTPSFYTVQAANPGLTLADAAARFSLKNTGLFVQDNWKISPNLSVMFGVRMDEQGVGSRPLRNDNVALAQVAGSADASGNVIARNTGGFGLDNTVTLDGSRLVQPRVGFNLKMGTPEQRMQLRGGFGLFQGSAASVWLANPFSNTGVATSSFTCSSFQGCGPTQANVLFNPNPANQPVNLPGTPPAANVDLLSSSLEQPSVWKVNLAFDTELPALPVVGRMLLGAEWVHTKVDSALHYTHLNLGGATRAGTDGRNLFYSAQGFDANCWRDDGSAITNGACATPSGFSRTRALSNPNFNDVVLASKTSQGKGNALTLSLSKPTPAEGIGWLMAYTKTTATEVNPLTSSRAISNWNGRVSFDPNEDRAANSNYLIKDRFSASVNWSKAFFGNHRTTVGVFYEGRRGKPYSWTYINDLNGDGVGGNDLMYIPSAPGSGEVEFRGGAAEEAEFWDIVNANPELSAARGSVVGRNTSFNPWVNTFDVRFTQELPGFTKQHKAVFTLDVLNFGNLLNKKWGRTEEIGFPSNRSFVNYTGLNADGKYVYSLGSVEGFNVRQSANESAWALQATLRYEF